MGRLFHFVILFLATAIAAAIVSFAGVAGVWMEGAQIVFWVAVILFLISFVANLVRHRA